MPSCVRFALAQLRLCPGYVMARLPLKSRALRQRHDQKGFVCTWQAPRPQLSTGLVLLLFCLGCMERELGRYVATSSPRLNYAEQRPIGCGTHYVGEQLSAVLRLGIVNLPSHGIGASGHGCFSDDLGRVG